MWILGLQTVVDPTGVINAIGGLPLVVGVLFVLGICPLLAILILVWQADRSGRRTAQERQSEQERMSATLRDLSHSIGKLDETLASSQQRSAENDVRLATVLEGMRVRLDDIHLRQGEHSTQLESLRNQFHGRLDRLDPQARSPLGSLTVVAAAPAPDPALSGTH